MMLSTVCVTGVSEGGDGCDGGVGDGVEGVVAGVEGGGVCGVVVTGGVWGEEGVEEGVVTGTLDGVDGLAALLAGGVLEVPGARLPLKLMNAKIPAETKIMAPTMEPTIIHSFFLLPAATLPAGAFAGCVAYGTFCPVFKSTS